MSKHNSYAYDDDHPIPNLDVIDINAVKKAGGSDLTIVVATPLQGDRRSLERLLRKVERYLEFIRTDAFISESGTPSPENTNIIVKIHADSSPLAFELLEKNKQWVKNNDATLVVEAKQGLQ